MKVFISHSFADDDKKLAYELRRHLMENGIEGYLAEEKKEYPTQIREKILKAINDSDYLVAIYTKMAKESASVQQEIGYASGKHIGVIIMSEGEVPLDNLIIFGIEPEIFTKENFREHCFNVIAYLRKKCDPHKPMPVKIKEIQNGKFLKLVNGDITETNVDVIVNSANSSLKHGGGVAAHIVRKGGHVIQKESDRIGFVPTGSAAITTAGRLPFKAVIHAVGPKFGEGDEDTKLKNAVKKTLSLASLKGFHSISMPAISSGIYRFPKDRCAEILISESIKFIRENTQSTLETIEFCIYENDTLSYFKKQLELL